ncbi:MAG: DUF1993 domain-containing protein [Thalassotalea sp.]|nr:DUF1993 domain-containing protein [Thalassotalea sp.]
MTYSQKEELITPVESASHVKSLLQRYLTQLEKIVSKLPADIIGNSLCSDMFDLATNVNITCNFAMRGYCPLIGVEVKLFDLPTIESDNESKGKRQLLMLIHNTSEYLWSMPSVPALDNTKHISEKAGFKEVSLGQVDFMYQYIVPNLLFHMSMVYAIAKFIRVSLTKGGF